MRWFAAVYAALLGCLLAATMAGGVLLYRSYGPDDPAQAAANDHAFNFLAWEVEHLPRKWIYELRHLFSQRDVAEEEALLTRYFALGADIARLEELPGAGDQLEAARKERRGLEAEVEDIIEGRVTEVLEEQALALQPPLFEDLGLIFPPVDFELDSPPRVLAISPRDQIRLEHSYLLEPGLQRADFSGIEQKAESRNEGESGISALVTGTGGVATYPAVVSENAGYEQAVETAFHEWVHQYLAFFPLGRSYFRSSESRTLNETAANVAGRALADVYFQRYPRLQGPEATPGNPATSPAPSFDFTAEMRSLRRRVEEKLAKGQVLAAESLMEQKRREFAEQGVAIRRLNQAYFAFYGSYADTPGSIDPIGPRMQELLARAGSPGAFLKAVASVSSRSELDELLAAAGG